MGLLKRIGQALRLVRSPELSPAEEAAKAFGLKGHSPLDGYGAEFSPSLEHSAPQTPVGSIVDVLEKEMQGGKYKTIQKVTKPTELTAISAKFRFGKHEGLKLEPGDQVLIEIPDILRGRPARFAILGHNQKPDEVHKSKLAKDERDETPGLTAIHFHDPSRPKSERWRIWGSPWASSGVEGAKYAEIRYDIEDEGFFDLPEHGHSPADGSGGTDLVPFKADAIRVRSVLPDSKSTVRLYEVFYQVLPPYPRHTDEAVFTPGTVIGDPWTGKDRAFGGGPRMGDGKTKYPNALILRQGTALDGAAHELPEGWRIENGDLHIRLQEDKIFTAVEVACGDTHPQPKADGREQRGWSKLHMGLKRADGRTDWFTTDQNVPPRGVLMGAPTQGLHQVKKGDELVISARSDTSYVMALRVWYDSSSADKEGEEAPC